MRERRRLFLHSKLCAVFQISLLFLIWKSCHCVQITPSCHVYDGSAPWCLHPVQETRAWQQYPGLPLLSVVEIQGLQNRLFVIKGSVMRELHELFGGWVVVLIIYSYSYLSWTPLHKTSTHDSDLLLFFFPLLVFIMPMLVDAPLHCQPSHNAPNRPVSIASVQELDALKLKLIQRGANPILVVIRNNSQRFTIVSNLSSFDCNII